MKINKNIKSLFNLSIFLSKYLWLYFAFLGIAALFPLSDYISSATQATLLILCFPLLIIKNLLIQREFRVMREKERLSFLKNNITFPFRINLAGELFNFDKFVSVKEGKQFSETDDCSFQVCFNDNDVLVVNYYRPEIDSTLQVKYSKRIIK